MAARCSDGSSLIRRFTRSKSLWSIACFSSAGRLSIRLTQESRRFFRWCRIGVEPSAPLETCNMSHLRNYLDVPVIPRQRGVLKWRGVQNEIVRRIFERGVHFPENTLDYIGKV